MDSLLYLTGMDETKQTRAASRVTRTDSIVRVTTMKSFCGDKLILSNRHTIFGSVELQWPTCTGPDPRSALPPGSFCTPSVIDPPSNFMSLII